MATKPKAVVEEPIVEETIIERPVTDPWKRKMTITLPRPGVTEKRMLFVRVNDRTFSLPKGKSSEVPYPVYEVLRRSLKAEEATADYLREISGLNHQL